jgi:hypothetical protein
MASALLTGPAGSQEKTTPPGKGKAEESAKKIKELQKERIARLQGVVDLSFKLALRGRNGPSMGEVVEARMTLLAAELELTEKEADRITLYKMALLQLTQYYETARSFLRAGRGTELDVLRVDAKRLEIEIALERLAPGELLKWKMAKDAPEVTPTAPAPRPKTGSSPR